MIKTNLPRISTDKMISKTTLIFFIAVFLSSCVAAVGTGVMSLGLSAAKDKTIGESLDDSKISASIKKELLISGFKNLYARINVEVVKGKVMYTGYVANDEDILTAIDIAWKQKGVKEVINELVVDENNKKIDGAVYVKDSWITAQIKSKLILNRKIKFVNYTIVTNRKIVYLFGIAKSEEELQEVASIAAAVNGVEKVISHVIIKNQDDGIHQNK
jgi:osmotically-inducible protein OsmY